MKRFVSSGGAVRVPVLAAIVLIMLFSAGVAVGRYNLLPINQLSAIVKRIQKDLLVRRVGEETYVQEILNAQYPKKETSKTNPPVERVLDTSRLPLRVKILMLSEIEGFASSGGSLTTIGAELLLMDRLGNAFTYDGRSVRRVNWGEFPSNAGAFIRHSPYPLRADTLRTHYIAYDPVREKLFVSFEKFNSSTRKSRFAIAALAVTKEGLQKVGEWETWFETEDTWNINYAGTAGGGKMVIRGSVLYFTVGDYGTGGVPEQESELVSQDPKSSFGKIYSLDLDRRQVRVMSVGHRNPQGLVATSDGSLIDAEHGPEGGDELNLIVAGGNYGWPFRTYGTRYGTFSWPIDFKERPAKYLEPLFAWVPSVAVSSLIQATNFDAAWNGDLLVGSLKASTLYRVKVKDGRVLFSEPIWIGHRIRDLVEWNGRIVLMTDDPAVAFITVDTQRLRVNARAQSLTELNPKLAGCMSCHHFGETNPSHMAPSLKDVMKRTIASDSFGGYTESLKKLRGHWDDAKLAGYIRNPNDVAPGSSMPASALAPAEIREIVSILKR